MRTEQSSKRQSSKRNRKTRAVLLSMAALVLSSGVGLSTSTELSAVVFNLPEQALGSQFPGAHIARTPVYLKQSERDQLERELGFRMTSRFHTFYVARQAGRIIGYATFDTHRVRTKDETLFIVVSPDGSVKHVEVISFFEPQEYLAPARWLRLFQGRKEGLHPGVDLPAISGATMTTNAVARTVRKVLLLSRIHFGE